MCVNKQKQSIVKIQTVSWLREKILSRASPYFGGKLHHPIQAGKDDFPKDISTRGVPGKAQDDQASEGLPELAAYWAYIYFRSIHTEGRIHTLAAGQITDLATV